MEYDFYLKYIIYIIKSIFIIILLFYSNNLDTINDIYFQFVYKRRDKNEVHKFSENGNYFQYKNSTYKLTDVKQNINYSFVAYFISTNKNENVEFINEIYVNHIESLIIDGRLKKQSSSFIIPNPGLHEIIVSLNMKKLNSSSFMFFNIKNLVSIDFTKFENENIESMSEMFKNCINLKFVNFKRYDYFTNVSNLSHMFDNCISLTSLILPIYDSEKLKNISYMFKDCSHLKSININYLNTISVEDMSGLFYGCSFLTSIDLSNIKTSNTLNMSHMFNGCLSLTSINIEFFELNNVNDLNNIFDNCSNLKYVKLPYLNGTYMKKIYNIFKGYPKLFPLELTIIEYKQLKTNDICIIGLWYGSNYGSMLTYYALHEVVKEMGYSILMINDPLEPDNIFYHKTHPKALVSSFYNISKKKKLNNLYEFNNECKCFLVGSDQIWNIDLSRALKQFYFLGFVDDQTKKISYGTSFGKEYQGTEEEKGVTKYNLERFDAISVRDELSINIVNTIFGLKNVAQVCDPTLLLDSTSYIKLVNNSKLVYSGEYILAYILDPNPEIGYRLEQVSIERNIKVIIILDHLPTKFEVNRKKLSLSEKGKVEIADIFYIEDWLWFFCNSKNIITDSFHGTIFSIIFRKPFITIKNEKRGGERFSSLLKPLNLNDRLFNTPDCINNRYDLYDNINYKSAEKYLNKIITESLKWLKKNLEIIFN